MESQTPCFPTEIERQIFEIAAEESFGSIPCLCRVAWRVNLWLRPVLYRVLQIQSNKVVPPVYFVSKISADDQSGDGDIDGPGKGVEDLDDQCQEPENSEEQVEDSKEEGDDDSTTDDDDDDDNDDNHGEGNSDGEEDGNSEEDSDSESSDDDNDYNNKEDPDIFNLDFDRLSTFAPLVKVIIVQARPAEVVISVLQRCTAVEDLALWMIWMYEEDLVPTLSSLPQLKRLSFDPSAVFRTTSAPKRIPNLPAIFRNITHLDIINSTSDWNKWDELAEMPLLTHLTLHGEIGHRTYSQVTRHCTGLKLLILSSYQYKGFDIELDKDESKVVLVRAGGVDVLSEWEHVAQGKIESVWVRAAEVMKTRSASS